MILQSFYGIIKRCDSFLISVCNAKIYFIVICKRLASVQRCKIKSYRKMIKLQGFAFNPINNLLQLLVFDGKDTKCST